MWEGAPHPASGKKDIVELYPANMGLHHVVTLTLDGCVLLDGRRATTHWALAAQLADRCAWHRPGPGSASEVQPPPLAAGQPRPDRVGLVGEADQADGLLDVSRSAVVGVEPHALLHRQAGLGRDGAQDAHPAAGGPTEACQDLGRGGLPGAVGPQEGGDLAGTDSGYQRRGGGSYGGMRRSAYTSRASQSGPTKKR